MSIPSKWWIYIVPGAVVICSLSLIELGYGNLGELLINPDSYKILSSVIFLIASYLAGFIMNLAGVIAYNTPKERENEPKPLTIMIFENYASPVLVKLMYEGWEMVIFMRTLYAAFCISSFIIFFCFCCPILLVITLPSALVFHNKWKERERDHWDHWGRLQDLVDIIAKEKNLTIPQVKDE